MNIPEHVPGDRIQFMSPFTFIPVSLILFEPRYFTLDDKGLAFHHKEYGRF